MTDIDELLNDDAREEHLENYEVYISRNTHTQRINDRIYPSAKKFERQRINVIFSDEWSSGENYENPGGPDSTSPIISSLRFAIGRRRRDATAAVLAQRQF